MNKLIQRWLSWQLLEILPHSPTLPLAAAESVRLWLVAAPASQLRGAARGAVPLTHFSRSVTEGGRCLSWQIHKKHNMLSGHFLSRNQTWLRPVSKRPGDRYSLCFGLETVHTIKLLKRRTKSYLLIGGFTSCVTCWLISENIDYSNRQPYKHMWQIVASSMLLHVKYLSEISSELERHQKSIFTQCSWLDTYAPTVQASWQTNIAQHVHWSVSCICFHVHKLF